VKYLLVLVGIIGAITYIFVGGPKSLTGQAEAAVNRRQEVWERISALESARRERLILASIGSGPAFSPPARYDRGGPWASGYRKGFSQGYTLGRTVVDSSDSKLFFPIAPR